jgi:hypothetical protein
MACVLTQGFLAGCKDSVGGVKEFYISVRPTDFAATKNASGMVASYTGTCSFYKYVPRKQTSTFGETIAVSEETGNVTVTQTAQIVLSKMEITKQREILLLAQATLIIIAKDQANNYWLIGSENGVDMTADATTGGKSYSDLNGYTIDFAAHEQTPMPTIYYPAFSASIAV